MSEEQLQAFLAKLKGDTSLQAKLQGADANSAVDLAKELGFMITVEDLEVYRQSISDAELEAIAGGANCGSDTIVPCSVPFLTRTETGCQLCFQC